MTHASLFSGIGGPEIAATMLGWNNLFHCEINEFGRKILDYWYPKSKSYEDITKTDFSEWRGKVDVLTGGFPCQPFSYAGKRRGADDDRYLWPYMFKAIDQIRPTWIVAENVAGITTMVEQGDVFEMGGQASMFEEVDGLHRYRLAETFTMQRICADLEGHGYSVQPVLVPACAVGAPHRRDRVFIIARRNDAIADTHGCNDGRNAGKDESESTEERIQERYEIRQPGETGEVRSEMRESAADTPGVGRGEVHEQMESKQPNGAKFVSHGREWTASDTCDAGLQEERAEQQTARTGGDDERFISDAESEQSGRLQSGQPEYREQEQSQLGGRGCENGSLRFDADTDRSLLQSGNSERTSNSGQRQGIEPLDSKAGLGRWHSFPTVSPVHRGNDGIPFDVDGLAIPFSKWRKESLKAYGNAIVPQVMYEIFRAIELVEKQTN